MKMEPGDLPIAYTLFSRGQCVGLAGRQKEVEDFSKRVSETQEAKVDGLSIAYTLNALGVVLEGVAGRGGRRFSSSA